MSLLNKKLIFFMIFIFFICLSNVSASDNESFNEYINDTFDNISNDNYFKGDDYYVSIYEDNEFFKNPTYNGDVDNINCTIEKSIKIRDTLDYNKNFYSNEYLSQNRGNSINENITFAPIVWSNYTSDLYNHQINVKLSAWDSFDDEPMIYYTTDGSNPLTNGLVYNNPISISSTTSLKFYSINNNGSCSDISVCNYIFENIGNLNSGKGFTDIQSAIDDIETVDGDTIKVGSCYSRVKLVINKSINLVSTSGSSVLYAYAGAYPVIQINSNGSGSIISGFHIQYSNYGIKLVNTNNVCLLNNELEHCKNSIICDGDNNTLIFGNHVFTQTFVTQMYGINSIKSDNLYIINNIIEFISDNQCSGISLLNESIENITVLNNTIRNNHFNQGVGIYSCSPKNIFENNNISNFNVGIYICSLHSIFYNNAIHGNNIGLNFVISANNTFESNDIYENYYGAYLSSNLLTLHDAFYLNRLCDNEYFDFYSDTDSSYIIDYNWWGSNNPGITINSQNYSNIYNGLGNLVLNSWVKINVFASSFEVDDNSFIHRTKIYVEANYDNYFQDLSVIGFIPNGVKTTISCFNNFGQNITGSCYLKDGLSFIDFDVEDLFLLSENITVCTIFDNENISFILNKKATIDIQLFSTAKDVSTGNSVNYNLSIDYCNVTWISFAWVETGMYAGVIQVIVNGEIVTSINITNSYYTNSYFSPLVYRAIKLYNTVFASSKEGIWEPNDYYISFANTYSLDITKPNIVSNTFFNWLHDTYHFRQQEMDFIYQQHSYFVDTISMGINYHGDLSPLINFNYNKLRLPSSITIRTSNIYYDNILDENDLSIGYEGIRSFAIVKSNVTDEELEYWLNQKILYEPGLMKVAYGTFLTSLLVIYENDRVADESASKFNVTWSRISPVCVSLCNDYNCLYITGESDHSMGREAFGNSSDIWKFNFATTFSFSLIEQLVGNNVWNSSVVGSVTLSLVENYINNGTIEFIINNNHVFIKNEMDDNCLLFLDIKTGIIRDLFSFYGLLGTMPCYHDSRTDIAVSYGNNLLNNLSDEFISLKNIFSISILTAPMVEETILVSEICGLSLGAATLIMIPIICFFCPDKVNSAWEGLVYMLNPNYKDFPNITIYEGVDFNIQNLFKKNQSFLILDEKSLDEYLIYVMKDTFKNPDILSDKTRRKVESNRIKIKQPNVNSPGGGSDSNGTNNTWENLGKYLKDLYDDYKIAKKNNQTLQFVKSHFLELLAISLTFETINLVDFLIKLFLLELSKENSMNEGG